MDNRFWYLEAPDRRTADMAEPRSIDVYECPDNPKHKLWKDEDLISVVITSKRMAQSDFIWIGSMYMLIQDKVLQMFRMNGFTGFNVLPVKVKMRIRSGNQEPVLPPILWEVINIGWGGIANSESGIELLEKCPTCNNQRYSAYTNPSKLVDEAQWDGSDFFMVWPMPSHYFVTERVAQFVKQKKLTGTKIEMVDDMRWPYPVPPFLDPGRLRQHMSNDRAQELGEPLGIY